MIPKIGEMYSTKWFENSKFIANETFFIILDIEFDKFWNKMYYKTLCVDCFDKKHINKIEIKSYGDKWHKI